MVINLINQGHEAALRRPVDLVNADGRDASQIHAFSAPSNRHRHGRTHMVPGGLKLDCNLAARKE